jgi:tRNA threonylcarbamoyladenosine biosynthesis protein TsaB
MRVMALDTTSRAGSVALVDDGRIVDERSGDGSRTHGERLPGELQALGVEWSSVDVFAVAIGPGSFTGLRIGIAAVQGLALVSKRPVAGVSALEALAQIASRELGEGEIVASWIDAQRGEVFSALHRVTNAPIFTPERLSELEGPIVATPAATITAWSAYDLRQMTFAGDGAVRYAQVIATAESPARMAGPVLLAGAVGCMATICAERGLTVPPGAIHPLYLRRPDVEIHRERAVVR